MANYLTFLVTWCTLTALAKADFHTCCPTCSTEALGSLNDEQKQAVLDNSAFIQQLEQEPLLLLNDTNQRQIVNLTGDQEQRILMNFPELFRSAEAFAQSTSGQGGGSARKRRQASATRVCPPLPQSAVLILLHKPSGDVVQLAQTGSANQWILSEACESTSPGIMGFRCDVVDRHVAALFINLSEIMRGGTRGFDYSDIVVQSCVAYST